MERQRAKARATWAGSGDAATEAIWFRSATSSGATEFLGYDDRDAPKAWPWPSSRTARPSTTPRPGETGSLVLNQTPFYGESGGQVGDAGTMTAPGASRSRVTDTQKKLGDLFVHAVTVEAGELKVGDARAS